ncbi:TauD/TfdA family dioxygenase [Actinospica durhamensis]|uniref:TauD/TfdA family dioxygenase n=1 Tax=Actinospica durhamensis TaxID=1508375 RepID=A0A941EZX9_9ACTN|nr:TauD/TfdA family dioxygenase [Actinospica durhamensis]MBR7838524.1 TauD/TfdA family dioxygenase [Actinospica durhamensis]
MTIALDALITKAQKEGWASTSGSIDMLRISAGLLGLTEVPIRHGDPALATLRPIEQIDAPPNSLSARYGTGDQPLHTDGAHLEQPPDLVVLACEGTSATPTRLWMPRRRESERLVMEPEYVRHGIFLVHSGKGSFFSPAAVGVRFRYDPGCMTPCDERARRTAAYFERFLERATEHQWDQPDTILIIDNRRVLHARASAAEEPEREIQRIAYRLKSEA